MVGPKLSIITLVFNQAPFLSERIRSILAQTNQDFEWIVIDDCSTDNSVEILQEVLADVPQIKKLILHDRNLGVFKSYNEALACCEGEYVYRAEGDDSCSPDLLEKSTAFLDANPEVGFVHTAYDIIDSDNRTLRTVCPLSDTSIQKRTEVFKKLALQGNYICSPSVTFRRALCEDVGGMSDEWIFAGDYELWLKFSVWYDVGYIAEPLVQWRRMPQAISKRGAISPQGATEVYRVLKKVFAELPPDRHDLKCLYEPAVRHVSTLSMPAKALWWLFVRHDMRMAGQMLKEASRYDPGVWRSPSSYVAVLRELLPRALRKLLKRGGGSTDFLPR